MLIDSYQRSINYLRVSLTDRCNFRCVYCMPAEGVNWKTHNEILSYEEITKFITVAAKLGIRRIRLTGGEPLVRRGLPDLVKSLRAIPEIEDISMTTNGVLLEQYARELADAGLNRVNVSLDTLNAEKFKKITRGGSLEQVWRGIQAAEDAGLTPIKINAVVVRGVNDDELVDLARLTVEHPWQVRFIEFMPVANEQDWGAGFPVAGKRYLPINEIRQILAPLQLEEAVETNGNGPAKLSRIPGALGKVGFISPVGEHFCSSCNRLRLTADGSLRPCLLSEVEIPIREAIRRGEDMTPYIQKAIGLKPEGHLLADSFNGKRKMAQIGG